MSDRGVAEKFRESHFYTSGKEFCLATYANHQCITIARARQVMNELKKENVVYKIDQDKWQKTIKRESILDQPLICQETIRETEEDLAWWYDLNFLGRIARTV